MKRLGAGIYWMRWSKDWTTPSQMGYGTEQRRQSWVRYPVMEMCFIFSINARLNSLNRQARSATARSPRAGDGSSQTKAQGNRVSKKLTQARQAESTAIALERDVKTLTQWLNHDVLELAGPARSSGKVI